MLWLIIASLLAIGAAVYLWLDAADDEIRLDEAFEGSSSRGMCWSGAKRSIRRKRIASIVLAILGLLLMPVAFLI